MTRRDILPGTGMVNDEETILGEPNRMNKQLRAGIGFVDEGRTILDDINRASERLRLWVNTVEELQQLNACDLLIRNSELMKENRKLRARLELMEERQQVGDIDEFLQKYHLVEQRNASLINLYVASYQLHSSLNRQRVLQTIIDIVVSLIGAQQVAVFLVEKD